MEYFVREDTSWNESHRDHLTKQDCYEYVSFALFPRELVILLSLCVDEILIDLKAGLLTLIDQLLGKAFFFIIIMFHRWLIM